MFEFEFGSYDFGTESVCQVLIGKEKPTKVISTGVSECQVSASKVTFKLAENYIDFFIVINRAAKWTSTGTGKVVDKLVNYKSTVQESNNESGKEQTIPKAEDAKSEATGLVLSKSMVNSMDTGEIRFAVTL